MDSITHIAVGACIGEAFAGKKIGKKAIWLGAAANSLPDIDFVFSFFTSPSLNLLVHRGITHSIFFTFFICLPIAWLAHKKLIAAGISCKQWFIFFYGQCLLHLLLDAFNVYGVGWLEPFYSYRFSFNWLFVADFLFSLWPTMAFIALLLLKTKSQARIKWVKFGLGISVIYLAICGYNKYTVDTQATRALQQQQVKYTGYITTPTPFNTLLWYVVAKTDSGYYTNYHSILDKSNFEKFRFHNGNHYLLAPVAGNTETRQLTRFSKGYYTVKNLGDTLVFSDLRFGQIQGWSDTNAPFVFYYYLQHPQANTLVMQRGRFSGWNMATIKKLLKRMMGN